ncbi:MAG: diaminopropionate ammonia-lyase [bacterium]
MPEFIKNIYRTLENSDDISNATNDPMALHKSWPGYKSTPLVSLPNLADSLGIGEILVKDESYRFGLKAFKVLGASYAIYKYFKQRAERKTGCLFTYENFNESYIKEQALSVALCTATDGNHGRGVAHVANLLGLKAYIYMPQGTAQARIDNISNEGAEVIIVDGDYDETVERVKIDAENHGWQVISDTAWDGYTEIPYRIQQGYATMFLEINQQLKEMGKDQPGIVFVQGGVGALAAATLTFYSTPSNKAHRVCVEPIEAACLLESIKIGHPVKSSGKLNSIMAGLNCGLPSITAWPVIRDRMDYFMAIEDEYAIKAMRQYYYPVGNDPRIISGESGASGLGALLALIESDELEHARKLLNIGRDSRILLVNTEGDTDPENFKRVVYQF